jgi:hypothetical protein
VVGFGVSGVESSRSATIQLISKTDLCEIACQNRRCVDLAQYHVK